MQEHLERRIFGFWGCVMLLTKRAAVAVFALTAIGLTAYAGGRVEHAPPPGDAQRRGLEGTWKVNFSITEPPGFPSVDVLFTFIRGEGRNGGTVTDTNSLQLTPNRVCTPDQGVWERQGEGPYIATFYDFCFDQTSNSPGTFSGTSKIRDRITLGRDGEAIDVHQYIEGFDATGAPVFVSVGDGHGVRIKAEAPPAP